ncbi:MAG: hypothetical protein GY864_05670, partial [Desulfobacterales bacterium]|nr:hypothetical protein [Desulfobacterales bacterium]
MSYIKGILEEERQRLKDLAAKYKAEIISLPKGSVSVKKRNQKEYLYIACREKGTVRFEYIGPLASENAKAVIKRIEGRKDFENKLKQVKRDMKEIEKVLNG